MKTYTKVAGVMAVSVLMFGIGLHLNFIRLPFERPVEVIRPEGFGTDRGFVGLSHNIFVGKVIKNIGQTNAESIPETRFELQVISNIKGSLPEKVIMNQEGGYENGFLVWIEDEGPLLKEGFTYLLSARTDGDGRYVIFFYPRGTTMLSNDRMLTTDALKTLAETNKDVIALQEAYKTEILSDADILHQQTFNSYQKTVTVPTVPVPPQTWN